MHVAVKCQENNTWRLPPPDDYCVKHKWCNATGLNVSRGFALSEESVGVELVKNGEAIT